MRSRWLLLVLGLVASACHQAPLRAEYPHAPRALRRAVRETVERGACSGVGPRVLSRGPHVYEVRGCGTPLTFVCTDPDRGECDLDGAPETSLAGAPTPLDASTAGRAAEIERLAGEQEADATDVHVGVLAAGAALLGVSGVGYLVGALAYELHECGLGACPAHVGDTLALTGGFAIAGAAIGLTMLLSGAISWHLAGDRRRERGDEAAEACGGIAFSASPWLASVVTEICFP